MTRKPLSNNAKYDVVVGGSLHLDIMVSASHLPRVDETKIGSEWGMKCGGKGGNQAVMAAKTGVKTAMIGAVGRDDFGNRLTAHLDGAKVDRSAVMVDEEHGSGMSVAIVQDDGEYGAVVVSGANKFIRPSDMSAAWANLGGGRVLALQNEIPESVNVALANAATHTGAWIILNAAPYRPMSQDLLRNIDCLILNRIEASEFFDTHIETLDEATAALDQIQSKFKGYAVVTLGSRGLVIAGPDIKPTAIQPISVKAISSHGAGDCFTGVFAAAIAKCRDVMAAGQHANKVAAQFVATAEHLKSQITFDLG